MRPSNSETITLTAPDGHQFRAYVAHPSGSPVGAVIVVQEVFGVTGHIRAVADQYATAGFLALAPALFDRDAPETLVPYDDPATGIAIARRIPVESTLADLGAGIDRASAAGKVGLVGFCWGGRVGYLAAARLPLTAAVSYYGGGLPGFLPETPRCPTMFHFGERDPYIPPAHIEAIRAAYPEGIYHVYPADHGFNCTERPAVHDATAASLAFARSVDFLKTRLS
jgi:carboxymethylenebutenolidase